MKSPKAHPALSVQDILGHVVTVPMDVTSGATMFFQGGTEGGYDIRTPPYGGTRHAYGTPFVHTVYPMIAAEADPQVVAGVAQTLCIFGSPPIPPEPPLVEYLPRSRQLLRFASDEPLREFPPRRPNIAPLLLDISDIAEE